MANEEGTIRTIYEKLWPQCLIAKGVGLLQWTIEGEKLVREGYWRRICYVVPVLSSILWYMWIFRRNVIKMLYVEPRIMSYSFLAALTVAAMVIVVGIEVYRQLFDPDTEFQIIESLAQYDRRVKRIGLARKDNFSFSWIMTVPRILWLVALIKRRLDTHSNVIVGQLLGTPAILIMSSAAFLVQMKFCTILDLLYQRYDHLNEVVLPRDKWNMTVYRTVGNRRVVEMSDLYYLHRTLTRATQMLAKEYSFELFVWCCTPIWALSRGLLNLQRSGVDFMGFTQILTAVTSYWILISFCHSTAEAANDFANYILCTDPLLIHTVNEDEDTQTALYLHQNKVEFSAWQLFKVTVATHLFIVPYILSMAMTIFDGDYAVLGSTFDLPTSRKS